MPTKEHERLNEPATQPIHPWRKWGPYVSERAWGTVREDHSEHGTAWDYFAPDLARPQAPRWAAGRGGGAPRGRGGPCGGGRRGARNGVGLLPARPGAPEGVSRGRGRAGGNLRP